MGDLQQYIEKRKVSDLEFAQDFDEGYAAFKIGVYLRQAREAAGLTQEEVARQLNTRRATISRVENQAEEVRLSLLRQYAKAVGKSLHVRLA